MKLKFTLFLIVLICLNFIASAQEITNEDIPQILDVNIQVGAGAISQNSDSAGIAITNLESSFYNPFKENQKLLPFKIEFWVGDNTLTPAQIRNLEINLGDMILDYGFSLSMVDFKRKANGIGDNQFYSNGLSPVLVNYKNSILPNGKVIFEGYLGVGMGWGPEDQVIDRPFGDKSYLRRDGAGFYLPAGVKLYGGTSAFQWNLSADYSLLNSSSNVLKTANPRTKSYNNHNVQMQSFHAGALVELKLEEMLKYKITRGVSLFARIDYNKAFVVDNLEVVKYSKLSHSYKSEVTSSSSTPLNGFQNVSGQVGVKINLGVGGKKKTSTKF